MTLVGLKVHTVCCCRPAVQLPGVQLVGEFVEFVKLMVSVEPFTGAIVSVAIADCPAEMELGVRLLVTEREKSVTATVAGVIVVELFSVESPS